MTSSDDHILDTSAVIALIVLEAGWQVVDAIRNKWISAVNLAEAGSVLINKGYTWEEAVQVLGLLDLLVVDFDQNQAFAVGRLRGPTRRFGLSIGDRACLVLAEVRGLPVLTADRVWADAAPTLNVSINFIR